MTLFKSIFLETIVDNFFVIEAWKYSASAIFTVDNIIPAFALIINAL